MEDLESTAATRRIRLVRWITLLVVIGATLWAYRQVPGLPLFDVDTYPQISSACIHTPADIANSFTHDLLGGRNQIAWGYRPIHSLLLAAEYALWGLAPRGYHLTTLAWLVLDLLLLHAVTARLLGPRAWLGPAVAAAFWGWHWTLWHVVACPARRSDFEVFGLVLLALYVLPIAGDPKVMRRCLLAGFILMLAAGEKETGAMAPALVLLHQLVFGGARGSWPRAFRAVAATLPALAGAGLYVWARFAVLHGMRGYDSPKMEFPVKLEQMSIDVLCPLSPITSVSPATMSRYVAGALAGAIVLATLVAIAPRGRAWRSAAGVAYLGVLWLAAVLVILRLSSTYFPWYSVNAAASIAVMLAGLAHLLQQAAGAFRRRDTGFLAWLTPGLIAPVTVGVCYLAIRFSPVWTDYSEYRGAAVDLRGMLRDIDQTISNAKRGTRCEVNSCAVYREPDALSRPDLNNVVMLIEYSVAAYVEMRFPEKHPRVAWGDDCSRAQPKPGELLVCVRSPSGYTFEGPYTDMASLRHAAGVFVIVCKRSDGQRHMIDAGESADIQERIDNHERKDCWERHCQGTLGVSVAYTPGWTAEQRCALEAEIRKKFSLSCGER